MREMREILSRGKRIDNGAWETGSEVTVRSGCHDEKHYIADKMTGYHTPIISETRGQFTGLTDKNGMKIFEGDIVNLFNMQGEIVFEEGAFGIAIFPYIDWNLLDQKVPFNNHPCFCYNDNFISLWELYWNFEQDDNPLYEAEVIGNIHDNPEMLGGGK